jgi:hypothetical protein
MKHIVAGLAALLFVGFAHAQTAPVQTPAAPAATQSEDGSTDQAAPVNGQIVPTVPVESPKKNNTTLILGAVGAAALLGLASNNGDDSTPPPVKVPTPAPSSP